MDEKTRKVLYPGKALILESSEVEICVYPMSMRHMKRFSKSIVEALTALSSIVLPSNTQGYGTQLMAAIAPTIMEHLFDLVVDCCKVTAAPEGYKVEEIDLNDLPHYELPPIVDLWIEESFGEEKKYKAWITMVEKVLLKATGNKISISELLSQASSPQDTESQTLPNDITTDALTPVGASSS